MENVQDKANKHAKKTHGDAFTLSVKSRESIASSVGMITVYMDRKKRKERMERMERMKRKERRKIMERIVQNSKTGNSN